MADPGMGSEHAPTEYRAGIHEQWYVVGAVQCSSPPSRVAIK